MHVVAVPWVCHTIITFYMGYDLFVQPFKPLEQLFGFRLFIFALVLPNLEVFFLENLIIVDDLLNLILLYFYCLERESSEA